MAYQHTLVAGTFDHLHKGHQQLLLTAIKNTQKLSCGLTLQSLTQAKPLSTLIQSPHSRRRQLQTFLTHHSQNFHLFSLKHPLQPAISSTQIDSIIASQETKKSVDQINSIRIKNHLKPLKSIIIDLIQSTDNQKLSSTRIRQGLINRQGFAYQQLFNQKSLTLPKIHRQALRQPFSNLLSGSPNNLSWAGLQAKTTLKKTPPFLTIAVGDIAAISLLSQNIHLNLAIVDLKTKRQPIFSSLSKLGLNSRLSQSTHNPPSTITHQLINALIQSLQTATDQPNLTHSILVNGEEDLAVLPAILLSPLNTAILYGQPDQGLVYIKVTETQKQKALQLLQKFI